MAPTNQSPIAEAREQVYAVIKDDELAAVDKQEQILDIGCDVLDADNGHIERVTEDETHEITVSAGDEPELAPQGAEVDKATTYCRRTLQRDAPLAIANAPAEGWADDPAYEATGIDCYLGTKLLVDGETYGTVCFVTRDARETEFVEVERLFVELVARLIGREIESQRRDRELSSQRQARERSEEKYASLMAAAPAALFVAEEATGRTVEVNDRATELVGYARDELIGMDQAQLHPPEQRDRYEADLERFLESDGAVDRFSDGTPLYFHHKDGSRIPVEISTSVVEFDGTRYVQGLVQDVSTRRQRQEELRVKDRAMDEASVGITIADATEPDLPLVYANQAFEDLTGYDIETALGRNCRFLQGPRTADDAVADLRTAIREQEPITTELINYTAEGTPFWNQLTITPVTDPTGDVTHFVGVQQDVTDRRRRDRLLRVLNRVLRHNLRNDMNAIIGYAELLADRTDASGQAYADRIARTAHELSDLCEKAQSIQRSLRTPTDIAPHDVTPLLERIEATLNLDYPDRSIDVTVESHASVLASDRLEDAIHELTENALKHAGSSGTVSIDVDPDAAMAGCIGIVVEDDGPGLPSHEQRVLETGSETPLEHGDGIGLWMVNWIVTGLGGTVTADVGSAGTRIVLHVPTRSPRHSTATGHRPIAPAIDPD